MEMTLGNDMWCHQDTLDAEFFVGVHKVRDSGEHIPTLFQDTVQVGGVRGTAKDWVRLALRHCLQCLMLDGFWSFCSAVGPGPPAG